MARCDEVFGWSKRRLKSTYVGFAQTSPDFCKKTPRCPGEFTIASAVSRGVPGRVGLCLWHFSFPHGDRYSRTVGSRRRERDARRPARTGGGMKKREFGQWRRRRRYSHLPTHAMIRGCSRVLLRSYRAAERVGAISVASTVAMELRRRRESSE